MSEKLLVPDIGDFENVEVIEILVKPGDQIKENDPIVTIESDKSSVEIPSTIAGKVDSLAVKVGDKVSKGDLLLNLTPASKTSSESTLPKDTENIIKQACLIIFSVSFGRVLSDDVFDAGVRLSNKSPLETLSPTLTAKLSTFPAIVEGISTLDLSLSIVTIGSFSLI